MPASESAAEPAAPQQPATQSLAAIPFRTKLLLVAALTVTLFVATMNQTVVATAAPNIVADIGGFDAFTWLFAGFALSAAVAVPIVGKLSDVLGRKPVIVAALAFFLAASAACGAALTMQQLIIARVFQGLGFAGVMGSVWIIMAALWAPQDRAKWMGVTAAGFTLSGVLGPVVGGVVSDALSWRWIFYLNLPVGGLALFLLLNWFPGSEQRKGMASFDIPGAALFALAASCALLAMTWGGAHYEWTSPIILGLVGTAGLALIGFVLAEKQAADPMLPLDLFRHRIFTSATLASLTITTSFVVVLVFLPLYVQGVLGKSATASAGPLMAMALGVATGSNIAGQTLSRIGHPREIAAIGLALCTVVLFLLGRVVPGADVLPLAGLTLLLGLGVSCGFTSFTVPIQNAMPGSVLGVVTSTLQFSRMFGMAAGSAIFGAVLIVQVALMLPTYPADSPQQRLADPEVLIAPARLAELREEFRAAPALGEEAFQATLADSRRALARAVSIIFTIGAAVSAAGIALAFIAFAGAGRRGRQSQPASLMAGDRLSSR